MWLVLGRMAWYYGHSSFMKVLAQQLVQRGYNGKRISHPRNGGLYVYEQGC
ncbi:MULTISPECIES: hypothetical protein [Paenibacillus]|uniref:hypothetical protein n=1 Tax=Paenibacillus TaxID=44249 RepID=UPI0015B8F341|nr:hypothetical protein [Paenibacillus odorifer]